ncbi:MULTISPECIES: ABC transporter permease [unclassified Oceanobacter]|jgi:molybdate transport system permease protein|uniref:ABC transporter permease n=1 Tax=unclassified Oceanobacter TaxID=2620260 RepID=UPI0026E32688|nr:MULTISPECIES: ABC transporter permease [unclassified Oceanobacter]MDO6680705.1 ABC transporter permease [Oceanobacter sp. 5_MG-2023]MDP2547072.1 ABC transporter permease [Oceanobacter sp. 4_MG-2023]MDP2607896.1 ABC transporter permease [Oceanobacter sp. 1_MG-2023]MDP2610920.1 ABC transporter permease [Oceanobacter sp. 2_MG-2023]
MNWLGLLFALPLVLMALVIIGVVGALVSYLSPGDLQSALLSEETLFAVGMSLQTSLLSLALALLLAVPAAHCLARQAFPGKAMVETLLDLPMVTPPLVAGVGLLFLLGYQSPVGAALAAAGINLLFSPAGIVLAQTYVAASIIVRTARAAFASVDQDYARMAWTLGLSPGWAFLLVEIPMAARGLVTAAVLGWARALGEFGATLMVAGATRMYTETLPMAVYLNIASGETGLAVACALILLGLAFLLLLATRLVDRDTPKEVEYVGRGA